VTVVGALAVALAAPAAARSFDFKTPGGVAYCRLEFPRASFSAFRCITPRDGFWIRFLVRDNGRDAVITKGYRSRYKNYPLPTRARVLTFGQTWSSSDAQIIVCTSRASGLTCKHPPTGLSFWLGRSRGYRIYYQTPGYPLHVRPLFRTEAVWCGIELDTLAPENPYLICWHPSSGAVMGVAHEDAGRGGGASRSEQAVRYRPRRFPLRGSGARVAWRCRAVSEHFAEGCSTHAGRVVFSCEVNRARVTCRNRRGRGFFIDARGSFDTF
jgi:hypothetical protein